MCLGSMAKDVLRVDRLIQELRLLHRHLDLERNLVALAALDGERRHRLEPLGAVELDVDLHDVSGTR